MNYVNSVYNYNRISFGDHSKSYINDMYYYYYNRGYYSIIIKNTVEIFNNAFLLFIINLLTNCVNYNMLFNFYPTNSVANNTNINYTNINYTNINYTSINYNNLSDKPIYLLDCIDFSKWFPKNPYLIICFVLYVIYLCCNIISFYNTLRKFATIRDIYKNDLGISDNKLQYISWDIIVDKIKLIDADDTLNIYTINNRITMQTNILISLLRSNYLTIPKYMSKFLEWNFIYCIIDPLENIKAQMNMKINMHIQTQTINSDSSKFNNINSNEYVKQVIGRIYLVLFINILALPFALIFLFIFIILKYGNKIYHNPGYILQRQILAKTRIQLRYYNELPHLYEKRMKIIEARLNKIMSHYSPSWIRIIYKLTGFIFGSIFILLLIISIFTARDPSTIWIFKEKSILWFLGISGSIVLFSNSATQKNINDHAKYNNSSYTTDTNLNIGTNIINTPINTQINTNLQSNNIDPNYNNGNYNNGNYNNGNYNNGNYNNVNYNNVNYNNVNYRSNNTELEDIIMAVREDLATINKNILSIIPKYNDYNNDYHGYDGYSINDDNDDKLINIICDIYHYKYKLLLSEIFYILLLPYYLLKWRVEIMHNCKYILGLIEYHHQLGNVAKYSIFTNITELTKNSHMILSMKNFKLNHRNWAIPEIIKTDLCNTAIIENLRISQIISQQSQV